MGLAHAVVTCVARDDLADGGAGAIAATVRAIRERSPGTTVEVLISDCKGDAASLDDDLRGAPRRAEPQPRDGGPAAAGGAPVGRLRPQPRPCWPEPAPPGWSPSPGSWSGWARREDEVVATMADLRGGRRRDRHHRPVPAAEPGPPAGGALVGARGVRPSRAPPGAALGVGARRGVAAHPLELPRQGGGGGRQLGARRPRAGRLRPPLDTRRIRSDLR